MSDFEADGFRLVESQFQSHALGKYLDEIALSSRIVVQRQRQVIHHLVSVDWILHLLAY